MQIEESKDYENYQYMESIQTELNNIDNIKIQENEMTIIDRDLEYIKTGIQRVKQEIEIGTFTPVKV